MIARFLKAVIPARFRPIGYLLHLTRVRTENRIQSGPFAGVRYVNNSVGSAYIPKLLGIYESELAAKVETICHRRPDLIVDIGAAEGYYAVGLAVRNPQARVVAFEMNPQGQAALREMAQLNRVPGVVEIRGKCEPADLAATLDGAPNPVVICDVEGYEEKLLDLESVPALRRTGVLVELHDFVVPGITEELKKRFGLTHRITHIWQQPRSRAQFPWRTFGTALLPKSYLDWSVSEWRPVRMAWLWMEPHA
ncbi:MAG TPA: hypothetical protein VGJ73_03735 [Verrucomicrobiae bacterium]|jgi:hypothetical protein